MTAPRPASLLAVFAHPDDEALRCGGTLALCAEQGAEVTLICTTRGEAGQVTDPDLGPVEDIAALREQELRQACAHLGIQPPIFLGYRDSGRGERLRRDDPLASINADPIEMEQRILEVIARVRPQVMLTFDPHGVYGHPDHLVVHRAATAAFYSSGQFGDPPERLFYVAQTYGHLKALQVEGGLGVVRGLSPTLYGMSESTVAARVDVSRQATKKRAALYAHRSQTGPGSTLGNLTPEMTAALYQEETFALGGVRGPVSRFPLHGLFEGLPASAALRPA